jgi:hypothetical protein
MGQCTEFIRAKIYGMKGYRFIKENFDLIKMINAIKGLAYQFEGQKYHAMTLHQAKKSFFNLHKVAVPAMHITLIS